MIQPATLQNVCFSNHHLLYKYQWNTKWAFLRKLHIFTCQDNMISSHMKRSPSLWLHNKSHLWKKADLVFHWCLYNKQSITYSLMDQNFIFLCSTRYLTSEHSNDKFLSTCRDVISSSLGPIKIHWKYLIFSWHSAHDSIKSSQEVSDLPWKSITKIWKLKQYKNRQTYQENVECIFAKSST